MSLERLDDRFKVTPRYDDANIDTGFLQKWFDEVERICKARGFAAPYRRLAALDNQAAIGFQVILCSLCKAHSIRIT